MAVWNVIEEDELTTDVATWTTGTFSTAYDHLCIKMSVRSNSTAEATISMTFQCNGDTGANYGWRDLQCTRAVVSEYKGDNQTFNGYPNMPSSSVANGDLFGSMTWWIPNYASSTAKTILIQTYAPKEQGTATGGDFAIKMGAHSWNTTSALTVFNFAMNGATYFAEKSSYVVYGINGV